MQVRHVWQASSRCAMLHKYRRRRGLWNPCDVSSLQPSKSLSMHSLPMLSSHAFRIIFKWCHELTLVQPSKDAGPATPIFYPLSSIALPRNEPQQQQRPGQPNAPQLPAVPTAMSESSETVGQKLTKSWMLTPWIPRHTRLTMMIMMAQMGLKVMTVPVMTSVQSKAMKLHRGQKFLETLHLDRQRL